MTPRAVAASEFDAWMAAFEPFERSPNLAVAVSGGADSLALVLLADAWARARNGRVTALTVDHGLRPEGADEARQVAAEMRARKIDHRTLTWVGDKPASGIQAAAREARYRLLDDWCGQAGILHLLTAHHADDQAETVLMRLAKGSGPDGLAAMAMQRMLTRCRLLRPLLDVPKARLIATVREAGLDWIEDPSNANPAFARVRARTALAESGADAEGLARGAYRMRRARTALEAETARWLGRHAETSPFGFLTLDAAALTAVEPEIRVRVLSRAARHVGGRIYPPAVAQIEDLACALASGKRHTLGGAVFRIGHGRLSVFRENRNLPAPMSIGSGRTWWDGRFEISRSDAAGDAVIAPLGRRTLAAWPKSERPEWMRGVPPEALATLPAVGQNLAFQGLPAVPVPGGAPVRGVKVRFQPKMPLSGSGFAIA